MGTPLKKWPGLNRKSQSHVPQGAKSWEERTIKANIGAHKTAILHRRVTIENATVRNSIIIIMIIINLP
jgi:hypothetical protein